MSEIYRVFPPGSLSEFNVYGRAVNGEAMSIDQNISLIGQDVALVLPNHNTAAVFDGSGGATDVGQPDKAALTAARAVRDYFHSGGSDVTEAMNEAGKAVENDLGSGVCVGSLASINQDSIEVFNVGDTGLFTYSSTDESIPFFMDQQTEYGQPTNYMGRQGLHMPKSKPGLYKNLISGDANEMYIISDGALGVVSSGSDIQDYHVRSAHYDYQLVQEIKENYPQFESQVRLKLSDLRDQYIQRVEPDSAYDYFENMLYTGVDDPLNFSLDAIDWDVWSHVVEPMARELRIKLTLGNKAMLKGLVDKPIAWSHEIPRLDDATVIYTRLVN